MLFEEYLLKWKDEARIVNVSEGWKICQDQVCEAHISPHLVGLELSEITPSHISKILQASKEKNHSLNQQKKIYNVLSKIFNDAIHFFDLLVKSPVRRKFHKPRLLDIERPYFSPEEITVALEYVMHHPLFGVAVWLQLLTGIRVSEVQALEWRDIDWVKGVINVRRAYNRHTKKFQPHTKNKTHYRVFISPRLEKFLKPKRKPSGLVVTGMTGQMLSSKAYDDFIKRCADSLKWPIRSSHGFRHSCARLYASLGATDEDLQTLLGHKVLQSTKTYIHRTDENLFEISKKIA